MHGLINSLGTKTLAKLTSGYVFINLGATLVIIIVVLATTGRSNLKSASYTFGAIEDATGYNSQALALFISLSSVQFVMTDYDATCHISEEVHRAAIAAPVAIMVAVAGTGLAGWVLNIAMVLASQDSLARGIDLWPGGLIFADILNNSAGKVVSISESRERRKG